jgi:5-formyltetrahydrofolate cyclo-ligase
MTNVNCKAALRKELLGRRDVSDTQSKGARIAQNYILAAPFWQSARSVALYMPTRGEFDTSLLKDDAWRANKEVWLPRVHPEKKRCMEFVCCTPQSEFRAGPFGILEPTPDLPGLPLPHTPDLLIVPAVAYDVHGYRIGYGGGYYDDLLALSAWSGVFRVGLVAARFVLPNLPRDPWDKPVQAIATEKELLWI